MRLEDDLLELMLATARRPARATCRRRASRDDDRADRGDGGEGLSRHARDRRRDRAASTRPKRPARVSSRPARGSTDGTLVAAGGRVLGVTATGADVAAAQAAAYRGGRRDRFPDRLLPPRHRLARDRPRLIAPSPAVWPGRQSPLCSPFGPHRTRIARDEPDGRPGRRPARRDWSHHCSAPGPDHPCSRSPPCW